MESPPLAPARGRITAVAAGVAVALALAGPAVATGYDRPGTATFADTLSFGFVLAAIAVVGAVITLAVPGNRAGWLLLAAGAVMGVGTGSPRPGSTALSLPQVRFPVPRTWRPPGLAPGGRAADRRGRRTDGVP